MTTPSDPIQPATRGELAAAQASVTLLERLADKLGGCASVTAVYGEPVVSQGVTVIPVARIGFGFGGGAGREVATSKTGEGGGGGGGAGALPMGFIEIRDGTATYKPIRDPWADVVVPLTALLATIAAPRLARRLAKCRTH
ncbi:spore germination protein GerW family protein [Streptomyces sp. NBC_01643]|uniref:spore germination protein GerW family protein n=1 Tax=Streptomyces sp. NBC_01643 TaxID=2975906 RepID=UPI003864C522|nr:spore germination protein GerW family protein [Streptomyces sp. NBC_01643]